jgi:hypothetical protein
LVGIGQVPVDEALSSPEGGSTLDRCDLVAVEGISELVEI